MGVLGNCVVGVGQFRRTSDGRRNEGTGFAWVAYLNGSMIDLGGGVAVKASCFVVSDRSTVTA